MPEPVALAPLFSEDVDTIHRRLLADVNAGREPTDPEWVDTTPGGWVSEQLRVFALECERLWDALAQELPAAGLIAYAWGPYLDAHAEGYGLQRKEAAYASGPVQFTGEVGVVIGTGVEVARPAGADDDPAAEPVVFRTIESGVIPVGGVLELDAVADEPGVAGNVGAGAVTLLYGPVTGTITDVVNLDAMSGGADKETDEQLRVRLLEHIASPEGSGTAADLTREALTRPGVAAVTVEHLFAGDGTARIVLVGPGSQPVGPAVIADVQQYIDPLAAVTTVSTEITLTTGATIEVADASGMDPSGKVVAGQHLLRYTSRTDTELHGVTGGDGVTLEVGAQIGQSGRGAGRAPVGLTVVVATATTLDVDVDVTVVCEAGYSVGGEGGTIDPTDPIAAAVAGYINALLAGADVVDGRAEAAVFGVKGIYDVPGLLLNGAPGNLEVGPLQIAKCGEVTVS